MKKYAGTALKFAVTLALGIFLVWLGFKDMTQQNWNDLKVSFAEANYWWLLLSILAGILSHLSRAYRWKMLLKPMGFSPSLANCFYAVMGGYFANYGLPRLGEVVRCGMLKRAEDVPVSKSLGTVIVERGIDLAILITLFFVSLVTLFGKVKGYLDEHVLHPLMEKINNLASQTTSLILIFVAVAIVLYLGYRLREKVTGSALFEKLSTLASGFWEGIKTVGKLDRVWVFVFHTAFIWVMYFMMIYLGFFALEQTSGLGVDAAFAILVFSSVAIIFVPGGIGAYQIIVQSVLYLFAVVDPFGLAYGWIVWSGQTVMIISLGILSFVMVSISEKKKK